MTLETKQGWVIHHLKISCSSLRILIFWRVLYMITKVRVGIIWGTLCSWWIQILDFKPHQISTRCQYYLIDAVNGHIQAYTMYCPNIIIAEQEYLEKLHFTVGTIKNTIKNDQNGLQTSFQLTICLFEFLMYSSRFLIYKL